MKYLRALGLIIGLTVLTIGCGGASSSGADYPEATQVMENVYKWKDTANSATCYFFDGDISCISGAN